MVSGVRRAVADFHADFLHSPERADEDAEDLGDPRSDEEEP